MFEMVKIATPLQSGFSICSPLSSSFTKLLRSFRSWSAQPSTILDRIRKPQYTVSSL